MARVAIIGNYAPSLQNFRGDLIRALSEQGDQILAIAPEDDATIRNFISGLGGEFRSVAMSRSGMSPFADLFTLYRLLLILVRQRPDMVLAYTIKPVIYGIAAAWLAGVPVRHALITGRGSVFTETATVSRRVRRIVHALYRFALGRCRSVIFQNPDDRDFFVREGLCPPWVTTAVVGGSGVALDRLTPDPFPSEGFSFLLVARLIDTKGIREYLAAAALLKQRGRQGTCVLAGPYDSNPGGYSSETLCKIEGWDSVRCEIRWHGDVPALMKGCHVYVLPSYAEGMPRTVLEAMALGRPVITTDVPGCRDTVRLTERGQLQRQRGGTVMEGENGYLVRVRDAVALADAMERCMELSVAELSRMGQRSRALAEEKFDVRVVNSEMMKALRGQS